MIWLPLLLLVLLVPWAWAKMLLCCAVIVSLTYIRSLSRSSTAALLGLLFAFAYLFSPYWRIPCEAKKHALGPLIGNWSAMALAAGLLLVIGAAWAWLSSGEVARRKDTEPQHNRSDVLMAAVLAVFVLALNLAPLYYSIPVHGDEDWHIWRLRNLYMGLAPLFSGSNTAITLLVLVAAGLFLALPRRPALHIRMLIICVIGLAAAVAFSFLDGKGMTYLLLRYPFLSCWLHQLGPVWKGSLFDEGAYRVIPLLAVWAIAYFLMRQLRREGIDAAGALLATAAISLIPNLYYHAAALYLELPAVALMTVALFYVERLITDEPDNLRTCPGWYAFLAAGFVKETIAATVAAVIVLRLVLRGRILLKSRQICIRTVSAELIAIACMAAPLAVYLFIRGFFGDVRAYDPRFMNLSRLSLYLTAAKSLWTQYGLLLPIAVAGAVSAIYRKRSIFAVSLILIWAAEVVFHMMDSPQFVGLARFNLFLFAPMAVLAFELIIWLSRHWKYAAIALSVVWIVSNLLMSPVAFTGERKPYWISKDTMTCEFYFPKEDAVRWLRQNRPGVPFVVGGAYTDTKIGWYFNKAGFRPQFAVVEARLNASPIDNLQAAITAAASNGIPMVLYFRMTPGTQLGEDEKTIFNYTATQVFTNRWLAIVLYEAGPK